MTANEHHSKVQHNEQFIDTVFGDYVASATPFTDWVVTVIFYVAVHKVDEYLASLRNSEHPMNHGGRRRLVHLDRRIGALGST